MKCKKCHRTVDRVKVDEHRYIYKCRHCGAVYGSVSSNDKASDQASEQSGETNSDTEKSS